jgi:hypothetical protein
MRGMFVTSDARQSETTHSGDRAVQAGEVGQAEEADQGAGQL